MSNFGVNESIKDTPIIWIAFWGNKDIYYRNTVGFALVVYIEKWMGHLA